MQRLAADSEQTSELHRGVFQSVSPTVLRAAAGRQFDPGDERGFVSPVVHRTETKSHRPSLEVAIMLDGTPAYCPDQEQKRRARS